MPHHALVVLVHSARALGSGGAELTRAVRDAAPGAPVHDARGLQERLSGEEAIPSVLAELAGAFSLITLALAAIDLYGVLAYSVTAQRREIAMHMAIGVTPRRIRARFLRIGIAMAGRIATGSGAGVLVSGWLASVLPEIEPTDPATYGTAALLVLSVAAVLSLLPASHAAHVDPTQVLAED